MIKALFILSLIMNFILYLFLLFINSNKRKKYQIDLGKYIFINLTICFFEYIFISFLLALGGCYSLTSLTFIELIKGIPLFFYVFHHKNFLFPIKVDRHIEWSLIILLVVSSFIYFFFPTEYLWGRRDPIMYVIKGVEIAKHGGIVPHTNEFLNLHYDEIKEFTDLTYRGVYSDFEEGLSNLPGDIHFQFLDFFPSFLAIIYSMTGLEGLFRSNAIIGILCILAIFYFGKEFWNRKIGIAAAVLIALSPAQIWGARIPQTELLYQLSWIIGMYLLGIAWKNGESCAAYLGGCIIGFIGLNRIDGYILGIGIIAVGIYCNLYIPKKSKLTKRVCLSYLLASAVSYLYSYIYSFYYIRDHWNAGVLSLLIWGNILVAAVWCITYFLKSKISKKIMKYNFLENIFKNKYQRIVICWLLFWFCRWLYFGRPLLQTGDNRDADFARRAFREFSWYTSISAILLVLVALYFFMKEWEKRKELLFFIATGMSSIIVYIWKPSVADDHIWASRRWASVCIPFLLILAAYGLERISIYIKKKYLLQSFFWGVVAVICSFYIYQSRLFLFQPMLNEMKGQYDALASCMDDENAYFAQMSHFGSVLRFIYDKNVFILKEDSIGAVKDYLQKNDEIYFIGDIDIFQDEVRYETLYKGKVEGTYLFQVKAEYPQKLTTTGAATNIYRLYR